MAELQDIFLQYGEEYRGNNKLSWVQHKAMTAIEQCRTTALGAHVDTCEKCGFTEISYNSCRNRHCPKCQTLSKERWIEKRKQDLLKVAYFHLVFTVPSELRMVFYQNQTTMYNLLFRTVAETLKELSGDKKYLGAKLDLLRFCILGGKISAIIPIFTASFPAAVWMNWAGGKLLEKSFSFPFECSLGYFVASFCIILKGAPFNSMGRKNIWKTQRTGAA